MTRETDEFRKNRVLTTLESLAVRLEVVVGYLERSVAVELAAEVPVVGVSEAEKKVEAALLEKMEERFFAAERLAERVNSGEVTEEEKEEYMTRWQRGPA